MTFSQSTHRQTLIDILADRIREESDNEGLAFHNAAVRVALEWLGYNFDDLTFIDSQDRGIDAWTVGDTSVDIFQVKTHEPKDEILNLDSFDNTGVQDIERAKNFLLTGQPNEVKKRELRDLLHQWASLLRTAKLQDRTTEIPVSLHLVILGDELTPNAVSEFEAFQKLNETSITIDDIPVRFYAVLHNCDQIIDRRWKQDNRDWSDKFGRKIDHITLVPWNEQYMVDRANAVFYCRAIDLVNAYENLGYQLFEPNVRANITNSKVNQEIRNSVMRQRTRRDFRFLNNGVTITCDSFKSPRQQTSQFTLYHPGVVNGLQTVVALHTAYRQLLELEKTDFEENCAVLVRVLLNNAVEDITRVVKSTNNQNPMKLRNLVSNSEEQLNFARLFAEELGWFYEAKEGAWDAFKHDYQRWRPRLNKRPRDFEINGSGRSRRIRRIDNEELAQTWLAFIGFANEAANEKKYLFEDRFYDLVFKQQPRKHGHDYGFSLARSKDEAINQSPSPSLMLVAHLCRRFAVEITPSASENRLNACERLGINPSLPKAELDSRLSQDNTFVLHQALAGMSLLFTEFVGFVLYRALGENINRWGTKIIRNHSFFTLSTESIEMVKAQPELNQRDILYVLWLVFVDQIDDMLNSQWGQAYRAASVKIRFTFSRETRERLYRDVESMDEFMKKRSIWKEWAVGIAQGQGLFEFIKSCTFES